MTNHKLTSTLAIGHHRPVYLWAGPGTVRMNRLKFMGAPVDTAVHAEAHTATGARRMAEAGFNWAYLMYNWGFPPEIEQEDWADFRRATAIYQQAGVRVFGYIQLSNCVYDGTFRTKDWYALDPRGRPFHYYTGRYMTCWRHPEWLDQLRSVVRGIVEAEADGVFFDNPWHGCQPLGLGGTWLGAAGCYCPRCRAAFRQATGLEIPEHIDPAADDASRRYLQWRAAHVTETLASLTDQARALNPGVVISANDFDAVMRPSYLLYGIDLPALAGVQDVIMIEDYGLPRWQAKGRQLVNNALTLRTARALCGDTPLSTDPYDQGIGFDGVYSSRRFRQGIAEAAACEASMVVKGTEYVEDGTFTLLTAKHFAPQRVAIGHLHRWLAEQADLYTGRENAAPVGLRYPGDGLWQDWHRIAPLYFAAGQVLLAAGIAWRVVRAGDDLTGLEVLLCFEGEPGPDRSAGLRQIEVPRLPGWQPAAPSWLASRPGVRHLAGHIAGDLFQAYFRRRWMRTLADNLGLVHRVWQTPFFRLPTTSAADALLAALGPRPGPRVHSEAPVLVELWRRSQTWQLHLVNYAPRPQPIKIELDRAVRGRGLSPDAGSPPLEFQGRRLALDLDIYVVLEYVVASR